MFVDMSQGNVGKWGQLQAVEIDWQVGGVAAMGHEDLDTAVQGNLYILQQGSLDFSRMIAESMDRRVNILKIDRGQVFIHYEGHVGTPGKA